MAKLPDGEMGGYRDREGIETIKHRHIHIRYTSASPLPENRKMWKLKDVIIVSAQNLTYKFCTGTY